MARLTWQDVRAPQFSTRDIALAGETMTRGFDRLAQTLMARENQMRADATNKAIAQRLAVQDPTAMGQLDLSGLDRRVDTRALVEADNAHRSDLIQRAGQQEDLLNKRALAQFGEQHHDLAVAALNGNEAAVAEIRQRSAADPLWGRFMGQVTKDLMDYRATGIDDREEFRKNQALEKDRATGRALQVRELNNRERRQNELDQGYSLGQQFARKYRLHDATSAAALLPDDPDFQQLTPLQQQGVLQSFTPTHGALIARTDVADAGFAKIDSMMQSRLRALEAEGNRAENQAKDPSLTSLRRAGTYGDSLTMDQVVSNLAPRMGWAQNDTTARAGIQRLMADVPGATLADIQAAIDVHGFDPGFFKHIPFTDIIANRIEGRALRERVEQAVQARARGYTANESVDVAAARAPSESAAAELAKLREQANRYVRANKPVPLSIENRLAELLEQRTQ